MLVIRHSGGPLGFIQFGREILLRLKKDSWQRIRQNQIPNLVAHLVYIGREIFNLVRHTCQLLPLGCQ